MSQEANYTVTVKTPRGNLVTVRGDTADEWVANLTKAGTSGALVIIAGIEASLAGQPPSPTPPPASGTQQGSQARPSAPTATAGASPVQTAPSAAPQELPAEFGVKCDTCGAAARFEKEGVSGRSGLPYKRYSCTASQLHKATFTN